MCSCKMNASSYNEFDIKANVIVQMRVKYSSFLMKINSKICFFYTNGRAIIRVRKVMPLKRT